MGNLTTRRTPFAVSPSYYAFHFQFGPFFGGSSRCIRNSDDPQRMAPERLQSAPETHAHGNGPKALLTTTSQRRAQLPRQPQTGLFLCVQIMFQFGRTDGDGPSRELSNDGQSARPRSLGDAISSIRLPIPGVVRHTVVGT